jgi:hypothetical protein
MMCNKISVYACSSQFVGVGLKRGLEVLWKVWVGIKVVFKMILCLACHWVCLCHLMLSLELFLFHIGDNIKIQHEIEHEIGNFLPCLSNNFSPSFALATFCNTHTHTYTKTKLGLWQHKSHYKTKLQPKKLHLQPHKNLPILKDNLQKKNTKKNVAKQTFTKTFLENPWKNCYKTKFHKLC